jgi:hypothetical protein
MITESYVIADFKIRQIVSKGGNNVNKRDVMLSFKIRGPLKGEMT